ncbi:MAG: hypothetical protein CUN51_01165 [Candidatus Thermofonsia Clade 1 bacterium]|uniref:Glycosyltransferase RgtA/B/C/D-like domain-containing protein n=1 Tax=Candidatus Thermofonsia Clade 1 bacterium TaxID=2364210 RepID=A0A2M8P3Z4_9CHLR|nr:MAG: hypothetical protein CUN51_01165 [Candidatus Thermofonsia Clade 1 bacterium]
MRKLLSQPLSTWLELLLIVAMPLAMLFWWHTAPENGYIYDDAYISYRYAVNLANGHGLVWNVGDVPTQGYTNFLFVILIALGIRFGAEAVHMAHLLNAFGLALISLALYSMARLFFARPFLRVLPSLAATLLPLSLINALTGMETTFWTGLLFAAIVLGLQFVATQRIIWLIWHAVVTFLACLTRPESVLFAALWFGTLFIVSRRRRAVFLTAFAFGMAGGVYLLWLQSYFGAILPNSFYVKVTDPALLPGLFYINEFFEQAVAPIAGWLLFAIGIGSILKDFPRLSLAFLALNGALLSLLAFYTLTYPFMGLYHRFVYPALIVFILWAGVGLVALAERILQARSVYRYALFSVLSVLLCLSTAQTVAASVAEPQSAGDLFYVNRRMGMALARLPSASQITVAYNDAGILPFVSGVRHMDTVGLNENRIAREGKERGWLWIIGYVLGSRPDLIGFYTFPDGTVYNFGHGLIGGYYSVLASAPDFLENYTYAGGFDAEWVHIQWYVYNQSPYREAIWQAVQAAADFKTYTVRMP